MPTEELFDENELTVSGGTGIPDFHGDEESLKAYKNAMISRPIIYFETALRFIDSNLDHDRFSYTVSKESNETDDHSVSVTAKGSDEVEWLFIFKDGTRHRIVLPHDICRLRIFEEETNWP